MKEQGAISQLIFVMLKGFSLLLIIGLLGQLTACTAYYQFGPINFTMLPDPLDYPDMPGVILLDDAQLEIKRGEGEHALPYAIISHHRRVKILTKQGLKLAKVALPMHAYKKIGRVSGRVVHVDGSEFSFSHRDVQIKRRISGTDDLLVKTFTIPGAQVGAVVDYWYETIIQDIRYLPVWVMGGSLPTLRAVFSLRFEPGVKLDIKTGTGIQLTDDAPLRRTHQDGGVTLKWVKKDLPPIYEERHMPDRQRLRPWVAVRYQSEHEKTSKTFSFARWSDLSSWYHEFTKKLQKLPSAIFETTAPKSLFEVYDWVQLKGSAVDTDHVWSLHPQDPAAIVKGKVCSSVDLATLLWQILRQRGKPVFPAFVVPANGPVLVRDFPSLQPFSHALVAVKRHKDDYLFLDPACKYCGFGELPLALQGGKALLLTKEKDAWVDIPIQPAKANSSRFEFSFTMSLAGRVEGLYSLEMVGERARTMRAKLVREPRKDARIVYEQLFGADSYIRLFEARTEQVHHRGTPLTIKGGCEMPITTKRYGVYSFSFAQLSGGIMEDIWRVSRRYVLPTGGPMVEEYVLTIKLPMDYTVDAPLPVSIESEFGKYQTNYHAEAGLFSMTRRLEFTKARIVADVYTEYLEFLKQMRRAEKIKIIFQAPKQ